MSSDMVLIKQVARSKRFVNHRRQSIEIGTSHQLDCQFDETLAKVALGS